MPANAHAHRLLDAAADHVPVWDEYGGRYYVAANINLTLVPSGQYMVTTRAQQATFAPPHKWGITPDEAWEAVRDRRPVWHRGNGWHRENGRIQACAVTHGDRWLLNGWALDDLSLTEPPEEADRG